MLNILAPQAIIHSLLTTIVTGTPIDTYQTLQPRQNGEGVVSGTSWRDDHSDVPVRREVRDLKENYPDQWNLYLLGLSSLQWTDQSDALSYYSLTSIHGRPFKAWGDAPGLDHKIGTAGYCPHGNILFLGWHRPYLALFEEQLYKHVQTFASQAAPDQAARYEAAAHSFRMPYWDWARGEDAGPVPDFFTTPRIDVTRPDGSHESLWNPLYSYYFHPLIPDDFDAKWKSINATTRWPNSDAWDATSDQTHMLNSFAEQRRGLRDHVDIAFRETNINEFSNRIEEAHGWIHGVIGGGWTEDSHQGHMWPLEYAAFEPLFMLHHTNVDRLFALYTTAHPSRTFTPQNISTTGNVFLADNQRVDGSTPLLPFHKPGTSGFWTTDEIRDTHVFGYTYLETRSEEDARAAISTLYSSSARALLRSTTHLTSSKHAVSSTVNVEGVYTDWTIHTHTSGAYPSTFIATFSLLASPNPNANSTPSTSSSSDNASIEVGRWVKLAPPHTHTPPPASSHTTETLNGTVSLTTSLLARIAAGQLASLHHQDVVSYLRQSLVCRVSDSSGTPVPDTQLKAFWFEVRSRGARIPVDEKMPIEYSEDEVEWPEVTWGKERGVV